MKRFEPFLVLLCSMLALAPATLAQEAQTPRITEPGGLMGTRKYRPPAVAPIDLANSGRLESLIRAGNL